VPDWYRAALAATGSCDPTTQGKRGRTTAEKAAAVLAKYKLAQAIDELSWPYGGPVRDQLHRATGFAGDLQIYFAGTRTLNTKTDSETATVTLEIPLRRLYLLLSTTR
jgi:hypothetical protein